jgi:glycerophosphoryl diester phosphodiesterase
MTKAFMKHLLASLLLPALLLAHSAQAGSVVTVAHRGGIVPNVPENTLAAYRSAIACGVQAIEIDLRGTSDGAVVVLHDPTLERTTGGHGEVSGHTLAELKALDAGGGERIPEFEEVLQCVRGSGVTLLLDIKESERLDAEGVVRLVEQYNALLRVIVGARKVEDVRLFKQLNPNLRVLGFIDKPEEIEAFLDAGADLIRLWPEWIRDDPGLVAKIHARGRPVWTTAGAADLAELKGLVQLGVNGILADSPELLRSLAEVPTP